MRKIIAALLGSLLFLVSSGALADVTASDDFNRTNAGTLGANWTAVNGNFQIVNNRARVDGFDSLVAHTAVAPASTDYSVEATIFFEPAVTTAVGVAARVSSTQMTGYMLSASATTIYLERYVNGAYTSLARESMTVPSGSRLRLTVSGTNPVLLTCEMDTGSGFEPIADIGTDGVYSDSNVSRITDAGYAGVYGYSLLSGNMDLDDWMLHEDSASDTTPDAFSFIDQTGVSLSSTITSAAVTITGIDTEIECTATGGTIDVNGDNDFQATREVDNNDQIRARHTSSNSYSTAVNTVVDCNGVSDTFTSTTKAEPQPEPGVSHLSIYLYLRQMRK